MEDILVTTLKSLSNESASEAAKCIREGGGYYFRALSSKPKDAGVGSKVFFVENGYIRGYAVISAFYDKCERVCEETGKSWKGKCFVVMPVSSWHWIKPIPHKGFQGFRYFKDSNDLQVIGNWTDPMPEV